MAISFRRANAADAAEVATVYIASRRGAAAYLPTVGTDAEIRAFVINQMVPERETWVAEDAGRIVAVLTLHDNDLDQFYVAPQSSGAASATRCWRMPSVFVPPVFNCGRFSATLPRAVFTRRADLSQRNLPTAPLTWSAKPTCSTNGSREQ